MKANILTLILATTTLLATAQTTTTNSFNVGTVGVIIPDGNPVGRMDTFTVSGLAGAVSNVTVHIDITGGFNGDLYAYLVNPQGQLAVLLNRAGVTGSNPFGYSDAGFNITLAASGNDIHYYDNYTPTITGGQLTGTWAADGRNLNPQSSGTVFDSTIPTAGLSLYSGLNGVDLNGTWTLFVADLAAGGGSPTLNSAILSIMTVPEPQPWVVIGGGLALLWQIRRRH